MVKSIISAILGFLILIGASIIEQNVVNKSFDTFNEKLVILKQKILRMVILLWVIEFGDDMDDDSKSSFKGGCHSERR